MALVIRRGWLLVASLVFVASGAAPALAHAERSASTPEEGAALGEVPSEVMVTFTEPPIADASFQVFDGCDDDVVDELDVQGTEITAALGGGQPGRWRVAFHVVSGIDGHATRDAFNFRVRGEADCSSTDEPPPEADDTPPQEDSGGVMLIALFAGGTVLAVALALVLRRKGSG